MSLPLAQARVLRFVADEGQVTAAQVADGLRMNRGAVQNRLRLLFAKNLLDADSSTVPVSYTVTNQGLKVLADGA
ncbi:MAG TPA: MarR family transcriptional regulator [Streptosporangiaceae bacterium]|nr:MarR family transcriptional regulator [Streptosporangiaceae bacterium]